MATDADWVEDVRRWHQGGTSAYQAGTGSEAELLGDDMLGYEAAHPALQAKHWPDAPVTAFQADTSQP